MIKTPDQRLRVFISSTLQELAKERQAVKEAITTLNLIPVMFELGARPYTPRDLYTAYLQQSHIFIGIYWQNYGWVAPDMDISGLEDEFRLSADMPRLMYIKEPSDARSPELNRMIGEIGQSGVSYKTFNTLDELKSLVINDLSVLFTERFESSLVENNFSLESDALSEEFPIPPLPMVGRENVVSYILNLLSGSGMRLLTLTGAGGMGKTRLALEIIRKYKNSGMGPVCFVPLSSVTDTTSVASAILRKAFPQANTEGSSLDLLIALFKKKKVLLILDNFEHLISARLQILELLQHCPDIKILITSRELLHISGEYEFALQPLELATSIKELHELDHIPAAIELFVQRSKNIRLDFELRDDNFAAIKEICSLLDGIPLAIELAAARIRVLSPIQILQLLRKSLDLLKSDNYDVPDRHQTLKATVEWSFALLSESEQQAIAMLSVFSGGGSLEAASFVGSLSEWNKKMPEFPRTGLYLDNYLPPSFTNEISEVSFLELAESLLSKSLVHTSVDQHGLLRINFYQTIRHYCQEKLREFNLESRASGKHLIYYLHLAESLWSQMRSESAGAAYNTLDNDINNIEAALEWSLKNEPLAGLRLAVAMGEYWDTRNRSGDAKFWIQQFMQACAPYEGDHFNIFSLARLELSRAMFRLGEFNIAWDLSARVLEEAKKENQIHYMTDALLGQSLINVYAHRNERKEEIIEDAITYAISAGYKMALLDCYQFRAADKIFSGYAYEGIRWAHNSLELAVECKAIRWQAIAHIFLGFGYLQIGKFDESGENFMAALICTQNLSDQLLPVYSILGLGQLALAAQEIEKGCLFLGVLDNFFSKPGSTFVPIVNTMYTATLDHLKNMELDQVESLIDMGRRIRLNEAIQMALNVGEAFDPHQRERAKNDRILIETIV